MKELYENGRVEWGNEDAYAIFRPHEGNGYVKLLANGDYIFRRYSRDAATMSRGRCF